MQPSPCFCLNSKKHNKAVVFAETTLDDFWATGLDKDATIHTVATACPGDNKPGSLMTKIAARHRRSSGRSADLSQRINELKTPRKRNFSGNRKLFPQSQVSHP